MIKWLAFLLTCVFAAKLAEYRFGNNFGQVFLDYSGNSQTAINGESVTDTKKDVICTGRGIFINGGDSQVKMPPNTVQTTSFVLPSTWSVIMWVNSDSDDGVLFHRFNSNNQWWLFPEVYVNRVDKDDQISSTINLWGIANTVKSTGKKFVSGNFKYRLMTISVYSYE